ncbi:hypothetical protein OKW29_000214 [Paraburkholderia sp. CI3]
MEVQLLCEIGNAGLPEWHQTDQNGTTRSPYSCHLRLRTDPMLKSQVTVIFDASL